MAKKVLIVFHINFLRQDRGCSNYVYMIAEALKNNGYQIDFFTTSTHENVIEDFDKWNKEKQLISNLYFIKSHEPLFNNSWCNQEICREFNRIINQNGYDFINIHYIQWADLIKHSDIPHNTSLVYSMQDNQFMQTNYNTNNGCIEHVFKNELEDLKLFDKVACISYDEMLFWKHILPQNNFYFIPHTLKQNSKTINKKKFDVLFIGASNPYNIEGLMWFIDEVYPHISKELKIMVCGKIVDEFRRNYPDYFNKMVNYGFNIMGFCENLENLYASVKIAIVPIFRGTGMKIKTIEAMANNVPIVSTILGVDGFPDKTECGVLIADEAKAFSDNITRLVENHEFYKQIKKKQKHYFEQNFTKEVVCEKIINLFDVNNKKIKKRSIIVEKQEIIIMDEIKRNTSLYVLKIFGFIPLYSKKCIGGRSVWKILGLPIFKVRRMANGITTKYYILGLPIIKVSKKSCKE